MGWLANGDPHMRNALEIAYVGLSQFRDGVGEAPIDPTLPPDPDPKKTIAILEPYLAISDKVSKEAAYWLSLPTSSGVALCRRLPSLCQPDRDSVEFLHNAEAI